jgi:hypothetical protein
MMLRTPVCSYPIIVSYLSFNFLCLLLLYSIYLNGLSPIQNLKEDLKMPSGMYSTIHLLEIMRRSAFKSPLSYPSS